jgi:hypothetical protein
MKWALMLELKHNSCQTMNIQYPHPYLKGIFQPFELGGVTRLIRSAVKFWKAGNLKKKILMIQTHERSLKQISAA